MDKQLNVVVVGIGHSHAEGVVGELIQKNNPFNIIGYVEKNESIVKEKVTDDSVFKNLIRLDENDVLNGKYIIDGVIVESTMDCIVENCIKYLKLGVPIHADKPTGLDNDFLNFMDESKEKNIPVQLGYMYRYSPQILELKKQIANDKIGTIARFDVTMDTDLSINNRKILIKPYTGGAMYVYGSHILDIVTSIVGFPASTYTFYGRSGFDNLDITDSSICVLDYGYFAATLKTSAVSANGFLRRHLDIAGCNGQITIEPMEKPTVMKYTKRKPGGNGGDGSKIVSEDISLDLYNCKRRYQLMMQNFAYLIQGKDDSLYVKVDYEYEKKLHKLLLNIVNQSISNF